MLTGQDSTAEMSQSQVACLIGFSLLAILTFMVSDKVLSPQFIIWCYPFIPLITGRFRRLSWLLFIAIGLLSFLIYPIGYQSLLDGDARMVAVLLARNAALLGLTLTVGLSAWEKEPILLAKY
jgi:hypothetical protein